MTNDSDTATRNRFVSTARYSWAVYMDDHRLPNDVHDLTNHEIWARRDELAARSKTLRALLKGQVSGST